MSWNCSTSSFSPAFGYFYIENSTACRPLHHANFHMHRSLISYSASLLYVPTYKLYVFSILNTLSINRMKLLRCRQRMLITARLFSLELHYSWGFASFRTALQLRISLMPLWSLLFLDCTLNLWSNLVTVDFLFCKVWFTRQSKILISSNLSVQLLSCWPVTS